jgi:hypothetical protein
MGLNASGRRQVELADVQDTGLDHRADTTPGVNTPASVFDAERGGGFALFFVA